MAAFSALYRVLAMCLSPTDDYLIEFEVRTPSVSGTTRDVFFLAVGASVLPDRIAAVGAGGKG